MAKFGWKDPFTGEIYPEGDPRLDGLGNPPQMPGPAGTGGYPLSPWPITDEEAAAAEAKLAELTADNFGASATASGSAPVLKAFEERG